MRYNLIIAMMLRATVSRASFDQFRRPSLYIFTISSVGESHYCYIIMIIVYFNIFFHRFFHQINLSNSEKIKMPSHFFYFNVRYSLAFNCFSFFRGWHRSALYCKCRYISDIKNLILQQFNLSQVASSIH